MELELGQLELRYEKLRRCNARKEHQLVASLADKGQLLPVIVVHGDERAPYVLVDGYKRVRALRRLKRDTVIATFWEIGELDAVLLERLMRTSESDGALEQGWLLKELNERFGLSHEELARRFDKSQSWVSRRVALVHALPHEVQDRVRDGTLPAHAAMKYLVPMARAKRADCVRLITALGAMRPTTREVAALYATWAGGDKKTRELVVTKPDVVLRAREEGKNGQPTIDNSPCKKLLDDFGIIIGTSRRARGRLLHGLLAHLLPTEEQEAGRSAQQARWECAALFRTAEPLLAVPNGKSAPAPAALPTDSPVLNPQEPPDAR